MSQSFRDLSRVDPTTTSVTGGTGRVDPRLEHKPTFFQRWWDRALLTGVIVVALAGAAGLYTGLLADRRAADARTAPPPEPPLVRVTTVPEAARPTVWRASGRAAPLERRTLSFETGGVVERELAKSSAVVAPGTPLMALDPLPLTHAYLARDADYERALAQRDLAVRNLSRGRTLRSRNTINQAKLDALESAAALAEAGVAGAEAALREADRLRQSSVLASPFSTPAVLTRLLKHPGERALPGEPVLVLEVQDPLKLVVYLPERQMLDLLGIIEPGPQPDAGPRLRPASTDNPQPRVRPVGVVGERRPPQPDRRTVAGQFAIEVDLGLGWQRDAQLYTVGRTVDPATQQFPVELLVPNPDGRYLPGMFVAARFTLPRATPVRRLPREALQQAYGATYVFVVGTGDAGPVARRVQIAIIQRWDDPANVIVTGGLAPDARVIIGPLDAVRDGSPIRLAP